MLVALFFCALLIVGCAIGPDRTAEATGLAEQYLAAVAGGADDRGWSLLHPDARRDMFGDSADRYVNAVAASDWTDVRFTIESVVADDPSLYLIQLRTDPPRFLAQPWGGNLWILGSEPDGSATMAIKFEPFATGVWPGGG
jgi:hypothetical protein